MDTSNGNGVSREEAPTSEFVIIKLKMGTLKEESIRVPETTSIYDLQKIVANMYGFTNPDLAHLTHKGRYLRFGTLQSNGLGRWDELGTICVRKLEKPLDMSWNPTDCEVWVSKHFKLNGL